MTEEWLRNSGGFRNLTLLVDVDGEREDGDEHESFGEVGGDFGGRTRPAKLPLDTVFFSFLLILLMALVAAEIAGFVSSLEDEEEMKEEEEEEEG